MKYFKEIKTHNEFLKEVKEKNLIRERNKLSKSNQHLASKITEDKEWIYKNLNSKKAIFLSIATFGLYRASKTMDYVRRVGLW